MLLYTEIKNIFAHIIKNFGDRLTLTHTSVRLGFKMIFIDSRRLFLIGTEIGTSQKKINISKRRSSSGGGGSLMFFCKDDISKLFIYTFLSN